MKEIEKKFIKERERDRERERQRERERLRERKRYNEIGRQDYGEKVGENQKNV